MGAMVSLEAVESVLTTPSRPLSNPATPAQTTSSSSSFNHLTAISWQPTKAPYPYIHTLCLCVGMFSLLRMHVTVSKYIRALDVSANMYVQGSFDMSLLALRKGESISFLVTVKTKLIYIQSCFNIFLCK